MSKLPDDDVEFFHAAMQGVKRLKPYGKVLSQSKAKKSITSNKQVKKKIDYPFSDHISEIVQGDEKLSFARSGLQHNLLRELRQGKIPPTAILDLHKMTVDVARSTTGKFLQLSIQHGCRCVLIIHGKGKLTTTAPVLKNHINSWLQQHEDVLAFYSAQPKDGGAGAVYVLLRRRRL